MLFYIDFLAACASDADFVGRFVRGWDGGSASVLLVPGWAFTTALLGWQLAQQRGGSGTEEGEGCDPDAPWQVASEATAPCIGDDVAELACGTQIWVAPSLRFAGAEAD